MGWITKKKKQYYVDYWLAVIRTDLVNENQETEYYKYQSMDKEPNIFIDADNKNELNRELWTPVDKETFDGSGSELMRSVTYTPGDGDADQIKVDWIYFFSFREEKVFEKIRRSVSCADCEFYNQPEADTSGKSFWCDYRNGMYYYCPGYADMKTCSKCRAKYSGSAGRCSFHSEVNSVTGETIFGDCSQWNRSGECEDFSEAFRDDENVSGGIL